MRIRCTGLSKSLRNATLVAVLYASLVIPCFSTLSLDPTFSGGRLTISFPDSTTNYSSGGLRIFVQPSGRIIALGTFTNMSADGQLPGIVGVGLTSGAAVDGTYSTIFDWQGNGFTSLNDAVMYPDGRILRLRRFFNVAGSSTVAVARNNTDGSDDGTFSTNANIGTGIGNFGTDRGAQVGFRQDGKVLVLIVFNGEYTLYRLNADGTRDTSFGVNGVVIIRFNKIPFPPESALEMAVLPDGRILLAGHVPPFSQASSEFFVARLTASGNWDKTFGRLGFVQFSFGEGLTGRITRAVLQNDGKLVLCGSVTGSDTDVWLARFKPNGRIDGTFGANGVVINDFAPGGSDTAASLVVGTDGKIRIVGSIGMPTNFLVARFSASGVLEDSTSFGFTAGQNSPASDIALQPDGKIVVIGATRNPNTSINGNVFAIARLTE